MNKLAVVFVFAAIVFVQGRPNFSVFNDEFFEAASTGDWDKIQKLLASKVEEEGVWKPISAGSVRELKPVPGGHVYGESEFTYHESSDINGEKSEKSGGHKVINDDGKVQEFDFQPHVNP